MDHLGPETKDADAGRIESAQTVGLSVNGSHGYIEDFRNLIGGK
jgi:hypothetical protein